MPEQLNSWQAMFDHGSVQTPALNPAARPSPQKIIDCVRMLQSAATALRAGQAVPAPAAEWLAAGLERFLLDGGDLTAHLGLKPRRGGAAETPKALSLARERDGAICLAAQDTPGESPWAKANKLCAYLRDGVDPPCAAAEQLRRDVQAKKFRAPGPRRMTEIIRLDPDRVVQGKF